MPARTGTHDALSSAVHSTLSTRCPYRLVQTLGSVDRKTKTRRIHRNHLLLFLLVVLTFCSACNSVIFNRIAPCGTDLKKTNKPKAKKLVSLKTYFKNVLPLPPHPPPPHLQASYGYSLDIHAVEEEEENGKHFFFRGLVYLDID